MRQLKMKICSFLSWILLAGIVCVGNANALLPGDDGDPDGGGSGGGSGSGYWANISVRDQNNNPVAGVTVQLYVSVWVANELEGRGATGVTDSQGRLYLIVFVQGSNQVLSTIRTTASKSGWTILSESGTSSSTREYITPSYVMIVDTDGNGIADQNEYALAAKFAPTLYLSHPTKWLAPEPVEIVASVNNLYCVLRYVTGDIYAEPLAKLVLDHTATRLVFTNWAYYHNTTRIATDYFYIGTDTTFVSAHMTPGLMTRVLFFDWPGDSPSAWNDAYASERLTNSHPNTYYAHLFKTSEGFVVQYWFFYPYNDWVNNHEGDWEHINVIINSQNPAIADIAYVDYYFHHYTQRRSKSYIDVENNSHPIVYVGGRNTSIYGSGHNSGGSYPKRGTWVNAGAGPFDDIVDATGPRCGYETFLDGNPSDRIGLVILKNPDQYNYAIHPEMSWLKANVHWGANRSPSSGDWTGFDVGNNAPDGPGHKTSWSRTGAAGGISNY